MAAMVVAMEATDVATGLLAWDPQSPRRSRLGGLRRLAAGTTWTWLGNGDVRTVTKPMAALVTHDAVPQAVHTVTSAKRVATRESRAADLVRKLADGTHGSLRRRW